MIEQVFHLSETSRGNFKTQYTNCMCALLRSQEYKVPNGMDDTHAPLAEPKSAYNTLEKCVSWLDIGDANDSFVTTFVVPCLRAFIEQNARPDNILTGTRIENQLRALYAAVVDWMTNPEKTNNKDIPAAKKAFSEILFCLPVCFHTLFLDEHEHSSNGSNGDGGGRVENSKGKNNKSSSNNNNNNSNNSNKSSNNSTNRAPKTSSLSVPSSAKGGETRPRKDSTFRASVAKWFGTREQDEFVSFKEREKKKN